MSGAPIPWDGQPVGPRRAPATKLQSCKGEPVRADRQAQTEHRVPRGRTGVHGNRETHLCQRVRKGRKKESKKERRIERKKDRKKEGKIGRKKEARQGTAVKGRSQ